MVQPTQALFSESYLRSRFAAEFEAFRGSPEETDLRARLGAWASRAFEKETTAEATFVRLFFRETWGYWANGEPGLLSDRYTATSQYPVARAGETGGTGAADLALGVFGHATLPRVAQVLCEFKDVRSGLDAAQHRKGSTRSPVKQAADYARYERARLFGNEPVQPSWCIVSDMNEFRLYLYDRMPGQLQRFVIAPGPGDPAPALNGDDERAAFERYLFYTLFQREWLLSDSGKSPLERLLADQWVQERDLERDFYKHYSGFRAALVQALIAENPDFVRTHTRGRLVRLAQRYLDRCLFLMYAEDMGGALGFPPNVLRNLLIAQSLDAYYDPDDTIVQQRVAQLFAAMRDGGQVLGQRINRFNGGLFAADPELDGLRIATRIFCARGQGADDTTLAAHPATLLFLAGSYNFGVKGESGGRVIDLYALGRIFEQSITELEYLEAEADGRDSLAGLTKRKRDGVYYTPEWVTGYIVAETVGARLDDLRRESGLAALPVPSDADCARFREWRQDGRKARDVGPAVNAYSDALLRYGGRLGHLRVVDPACGSGAFLIQAFDRLYRERVWLAGERRRIFGSEALFDADAVLRAVLAENLYGVDINPESVEITKLALWLHTAQADKPLTQLDDNIRCGNSLVGPDFWHGRQTDLLAPNEAERLAVFDWPAAFPKAFEAGGFDCVIGNPPYVKLQHFRTLEPRVAEYLVQARTASGAPRYESTQTGNFDLYLPFIEQGLRLLRPDGRMGFIAPSLWAVNEYGAGLRGLVSRTRPLDRWVDFRSHQVFAEATTYTALQFYRGAASPAVQVRWAPGGDRDVAGIDWSDLSDAVPYDELPADGTWRLLPRAERRLVERLMGCCDPLDSPRLTDRIFQGLITSADPIYHLEKLGPGRYRRTKQTKAPIEVEIEDALMHPLVSGPDVKRYVLPEPATYLLFPYDLSGGKPRLLTEAELVQSFPQAHAWLKRHESELRARERGKFDDEQWYRFGRHQNLDKQELPKLAVAETVPALRLFYDHEGRFCLNNVRVNGILPVTADDGWFLLAVLNAPVADFVFRRTAKPKDAGWFEANKQFIAPLPVPKAGPAERRAVGEAARQLQQLHTERRAHLAAIERRLTSPQTRAAERPASWLWQEVGTEASWAAEDTKGRRGRELSAWARAQMDAELDVRLAGLQARLRPGADLQVELSDGELVLLAGGVRLVEGVFVSDEEGPFIAAEWRRVARTTRITEAFQARTLVAALCALRTTDNPALRDQVVALDRQASACEAQIAAAETALDERLFALYGLTPAERALVLADRRGRGR